MDHAKWFANTFGEIDATVARPSAAAIYALRIRPILRGPFKSNGGKPASCFMERRSVAHRTRPVDMLEKAPCSVERWPSGAGATWSTRLNRLSFHLLPIRPHARLRH